MKRVVFVDVAAEQIRSNAPAEMVLRKSVFGADLVSFRMEKLGWKFDVSDVTEHDDAIIVL